MADGMVSMSDWLGFKALDSSEPRRKQHVSDQQSHPTSSVLETSRVINSGDSNLGSSLKKANPAPSPTGFGAGSPKSIKSSSPSRKLQQVFEADGTILLADGLGLKALDSNEIHRKQRSTIDLSKESKFHPDATSNLGFEPGYPNIKKPMSGLSGEVDFGTTVSSSGPQSSHRFGAHSPKSCKNPSSARKLQQVFLEEGLRVEVEVAIKGLVPPLSPNGPGVHSPNAQIKPNAAQKMQQAVFEEGLEREAEARARVTHLHGNTYQFQRTPAEVSSRA